MPDAADAAQSTKACNTCHLRHVKCDKTKPFCHQCVQTGRLCDGYAHHARLKTRAFKFKISSGPPSQSHLATRPRAANATTQPSPAPGRLVVARAQKNVAMAAVLPYTGPVRYTPRTLINDEDGPTVSAFGHFWLRTVPAMHGVFEPDEWFQALCSFSTASTPVLNACAALSLFHRLDKPALQGGQDQQVVRNQALHHYVQALRETQDAVQVGSMSRVSMKLLCILFTVIESLQGHRASARSHFQSSIALQAATSHASTFISSAEQSLDAALFRIGIGQTLYGRPRGALFPRVTLPPHIASHAMLAGPRPGIHQADILSARNTLYACIATALALIRQPYQSMFPETAPFATPKQSVQAQLARWLVAYAPVLRDTAAVDTSGRHAGNLLLTCHAMLEIFVAAFNLADQTTFDAHTAKFDTIVSLLAEICLAAPPPLPTSTSPSPRGTGATTSAFAGRSPTPLDFPGSFMDTGILTQLFFTATKCRSPSIRRRAVALMAHAPVREGMWDAAETAIVASAVIRYEEGLLALAGQKHLEKSWRTMLINERRVADVDVRDTGNGDEAVVVLLNGTNGKSVEVRID